MTVADLSARDFATALRSPGLIIQFGPFAVRLRISDQALVTALHELFAYYPICPPDRTIVSFEIDMARERRAADLFRPSFSCRLNGRLEARDRNLSLALPILEWTMNWAIGTTVGQFVMLHAAVAERDGVALVMPGAPGSGKSTLCASLVGRGWRLFSDEFALIVPENGLLMPMPRPISLKNRSVELIRAAAPHLHFGPLIGGTTKGDVAHLRPPAESVRRAAEPAPPRWIIFPTWQQDAQARLEPLDRMSFFKELIHNTINYNVMGELGFRSLVRLVEDTAGYRLGFDRLDDAVRVIEELGKPGQLQGPPSAHVVAG